MKHLSLFIVCLLLNCVLTAAVKYDYIQIKVNDEIITHNEIEVQVREVAAFNKIDSTDFLKMEMIRKRITERLIEEALLDIRAEEMGIGYTEEQLEQELDNFIKQRKLSRIQFEDILEKQQATLETFKKQYEKQLRRNRIIAMEIRSKIKINEDELKKIYEKERVSVKKAKVRHILLRLKPDAPEGKVRKAEKKILALKRKIESGEPFEKVAARYSDDPSAKTNYGELGTFEEKDIGDREFAKTVFSLEPGVLSDPARTALGLHIVEVMEMTTVSPPPFSQVKNELFQKEFQKAFVRRYKEYMENLRKNAAIIENLK